MGIGMVAWIITLVGVDRVRAESSALSASLRSHVEYLASEAMKGREAGTPEERKAAEYLAKHFQEAGLQPLGDGNTFFQAFETPKRLGPNRVHPKGVDTPETQRHSQNVVGWMEGSDNSEKKECYVVIGAHLDHVGFGRITTRGGPQAVGVWHPGATDNASGVAYMIEALKAIAGLPKEKRPRWNLLWVGFGAEEWHLVGSKHYAKHPAKPFNKAVGMVNLAEMARGEGSAVLYTNETQSAEMFARQANAPPMKARLKVKPSKLDRSDAGPFTTVGNYISCYWVTGRGSGFPDYHKPSDTVDKIDFEELAELSQFAERFILAVANQENQE